MLRLRKATLKIESDNLPSIYLNGSERLIEAALVLWLETFAEDPAPEGAGAAETERAEAHSEPELKIGFQRNPLSIDYDEEDKAD